MLLRWRRGSVRSPVDLGRAPAIQELAPFESVVMVDPVEDVVRAGPVSLQPTESALRADSLA
jgi:hypothetical protein